MKKPLDLCPSRPVAFPASVFVFAATSSDVLGTAVRGDGAAPAASAGAVTGDTDERL